MPRFGPGHGASTGGYREDVAWRRSITVNKTLRAELRRTGRRRRAARIPKSACRWHPALYSNGPVLARPRLFGRACSPASGFRAFPQRMEPARWMTENLIAQAFSKADYSNRSAFKYLESIHGTRGRTRTGTASRPRDFKSLVSTIPPPGQVWGEYPTRRLFRHIHTSSEA